jgi:hypothetical protein
MATKDISFQVKQGATVLFAKNPTNGDSLDISGPCPAVTPVITFAQGSKLDMDGTSALEGTIDAWRMASNVKITANQTITGLHIIFTREHAQGPNSAPNNVFYKLSAKGLITNGVGSINLTGTVRKVGGPTLTIGPLSNLTTPIDSATPAKQWNNVTLGTTLTLNRILMLDLEIVHLDNGAILDLVVPGGFMKLRSQPTPDPVGFGGGEAHHGVHQQ